MLLALQGKMQKWFCKCLPVAVPLPGYVGIVFMFMMIMVYNLRKEVVAAKACTPMSP